MYVITDVMLRVVIFSVCVSALSSYAMLTVEFCTCDCIVPAVGRPTASQAV